MKVDLLVMLELLPERTKPLVDAGYILHDGARSQQRTEAIARAGDRIRGVVTTGTHGIRAADIAALPKLEIICCMGAGYDGVDLAAALARGITVTHGPNTNASTVADSAIMLLMAAARRLPQADRAVRAGHGWSWRAPVPTISGKKLGILGLGRIGNGIARRAAGGFEMAIGYHNRRRVDGAPYAYFASPVELAAWADFLVVATPGGAETRHLVNKDLLAALGPAGYLVNIGRGSVVDTAALVLALQEKTIAGAALDVVEGEPNVPADLIALDNVVLTPHYAGRSPEAMAATIGLVLQNLDAHFAGRPVPTPVAGISK
jgi:lactate dehydrogenase-like 2-hydroxyacid dehydrogenase